MVGRGRTGIGWHVVWALLACVTAIAITSCGRALSAGGSGDEQRARTEVRGFVTNGGKQAEATVGASSGAVRIQASGSGGESHEHEAPFVADQRASGGDGDGANRILAVRFGEHEDYERVVVDLGMGVEPAEAASGWTLDCPAGDGVLRVNLPLVEETRVSNGPLGGTLLKSFYVVRAPEEGMFVDFFAREGFRYRVMELSDPARIVVDFRPSDSALNVALPARKGNTVLVEPRRRSDVADPFTVSGYSRNPEATNSVVLTGPDGDVKVRKTVRSNDWTTTWGYFETTLDPAVLEERAVLLVGARSARDGTFEGVEIPVKGDRE